MFEHIFKTYVAPAMPVVAALLLYVLGRFTYFRQKEYELITKRYLEEGIDATSKNVEASLAVYRHNWWQATVVLKHFRDLGKDIPPELYKDSFITPKTEHFELWRDYRLMDIIDDQVVNRARQLLDVLEKEAYAFFKYDLGSAVRLYAEGGVAKINATPQELVDKYFEHIESFDKRSKRFYVFLGTLQELGSILQSQRFSFGAVKKLRKRKDVKKIVENLKNAFPSAPAA